jgi:hypothetical protein
MRDWTKLFLMGLLAATAGAGIACGGGDGEADGDGNGAAGPPQADTPRQALKNLQQAVTSGEGDRIMQVVHAEGEQKEILDAMTGFMTAMSQFEEKMIDAYGEVAEPEKPDDGMEGFKDEKWLEDVEIDTQGDTAMATKPGEEKPLKLVKVDGEWKISASSLFPTGPGQEKDREQAVAMMKAMTKAAHEVMPEIGNEGVTAEDINKMMGQKMMAAMMGGMMPTTMPTSPPTP